MTFRRAVRLLLTCFLIACLVPVVSKPGDSSAKPSVSGPGTTLVVMDTSGSMSATTDRGRTRLDEARDAVIKTTTSLAPGAQFGLIAYPGNGRVVDSCSIGDEEIKLGPLNAGSVSTAVRRLTASGDTPTGPALRHAADILKRVGGYGTIIVVSDGQANCGSSDLCDVAKSIASEGMAVQAHTVGFHHDDDELSCVSSTLGGRHVNVSEPGALEPVLQELSGARLEFDMTVPDVMPEVAGVGTGGSIIEARVKSTGQQSANNVRVSIDVYDDKGRPANLFIPRTTRFLGNLDPNRERRVTLTVRPPDGTVGKYLVKATAYSVNTSPVHQNGKFDVVKSGPISGILGEAKQIVVLGDSYASGEGIGSYFQNTDNKSNLCHRSSRNYGTQLFPENAHTIACSGAVITDLYNQQIVNDPKHDLNFESPQLLRLRGISTTESIDAVLMSIGGNDMRFGDVVSNCIRPDVSKQVCDETLQTAKKIAESTSFIQRLTRAYIDVDNTINDDSARSKRDGKTAPIVVIPYPRSIPTADEIAARDADKECMYGTAKDNLARFDSMLIAVNEAVRRATTAAAANGRPIYLATPVINAFMPDHTICNSDSYVVKDVVWKKGYEIVVQTPATRQIAHPNDRGHTAMASAIRGWSRIASPQRRALVSPSPSWSNVEDRVFSPNPISTISTTVNRPLNTMKLYSAGDKLDVSAGGFAPSSAVTVTVESTPQPLYTAYSNADGDVNVEAKVPANLDPGQHHVILEGVDKNGEYRRQSIAIRVLPPHSGIMALTLLLGVSLTIVGSISVYRNRRRRRQIFPIA